MKKLILLFICFLLVGCVQQNKVSFEPNYTVTPITENLPVVFAPTNYKFQITQIFENKASAAFKAYADQGPKKRTFTGETDITPLGDSLLWVIQIKEITEDNAIYKYFKPIIKYHLTTRKDGKITNKEIFYPAAPLGEDDAKKISRPL